MGCVLIFLNGTIIHLKAAAKSSTLKAIEKRLNLPGEDYGF